MKTPKRMAVICIMIIFTILYTACNNQSLTLHMENLSADRNVQLELNNGESLASLVRIGEIGDKVNALFYDVVVNQKGNNVVPGYNSMPDQHRLVHDIKIFVEAVK